MLRLGHLGYCCNVSVRPQLQGWPPEGHQQLVWYYVKVSWNAEKSIVGPYPGRCWNARGAWMLSQGFQGR